MYKQLKNQLTGEVNAVVKTDEIGIVVVPFDPTNTDYQAYLKWLEEGNEVLPPDEPVND